MGVKSSVKDVADGHAINFLIPRGLARQATPGAMAQLEADKVKQEALAKVREDLLLKNLKKIKDVKVEIAEKANDNGHLFAAIHEKEIAERLREASGIDVDPAFIKIDEPIKSVGEHSARVVVKDKETTFKIQVLDKKSK